MCISTRLKSIYIKITNRPKQYITKYSFGATSAIITSLALITGFNVNPSAKIGVVGSLLVIALADNISDTLGIHIYQEGESLKNKEVWISTGTNFFTRLLVVSIFILFVIVFPPSIAILVSIIYGYLVLTLISYIVAKKRQIHHFHSILEHLLITTFVIIVSKLVGGWIRSIF